MTTPSPTKRTTPKKKPAAKKKPAKKPQTRITARQVQLAIRKQEFTPTQQVEIYQMLAEQLASGAVGQRWRIELPPPIGITIHEDDLTLMEIDWVEARTGTPASQMDIRGSGRHLLMMMIAHLIHTHEWDEPEAYKIIGQIPVNDAFAMIHDEVVAPDPKELSEYRSALVT